MPEVKYTTIQGDMWDLIAKKTVGSELQMSVLIENNPEYAEIVVFSSGVSLDIPEIKSVNRTLPPWKRAATS